MYGGVVVTCRTFDWMIRRLEGHWFKVNWSLYYCVILLRQQTLLCIESLHPGV